MGLTGGLMGAVFGNGGAILRETAEVFRENAENAAERQANAGAAALAQYAAEFERHERRGRFDLFMDGVNRLPRPALALGTLGLFVAAMVDPVWFGSRMSGLALVPEPLWWLLGAVVSFYFGARHQLKGQEFQRSIAQTIARAPVVAREIDAVMPDRRVPSDKKPSDNAALDEWRAELGR
ncbi:hypothetical protein OCGS_2421 [Oceaniovalibus guishaninsula JLT2003]|uniref:Carboxylesterase n=1 Tax=Oceaniovalibus guishaninsula JLT2003 TaxID=1231392 RepID=K2HLE4_9RHOB|nr:holin family protein [Oceaniovalibus guishaninsula]EKE43689.1 hypothetical protein OCGS_2421 [Oceaniovalibus guishaninsula JLT2003]